MSEMQQAAQDLAVAVARLRRAERAAEASWTRIEHLFTGLRNRLA